MRSTWGLTLIVIGISSTLLATDTVVPSIGARSAVSLSKAQSKQIAKMHTAICKKVAQCEPTALSARECKRRVQDDDPFMQSLPRGVYAATTDALKRCTRGIKKSSCAEFFSDVPPEGCEFFL